MPVHSPTKEPAIEMGLSHTPAAKSIFDLIPLQLVLALAKPYLAGHTAKEAIQAAHHIYEARRFTGTLDILGEDSQDAQDCQGFVEKYKSLIDAVKSNPLAIKNPRQQLTISMKPSMFSTMAPRAGAASEKALDEAFDRISQVVDYALKNDINMTLEAEDHRWANFHLEAYFALINAGYTNLGTVVQTRLFRSEKDIQRFDERMRVRLVIGIYNEPKQIAYSNKKEMKDLLVQYAGQLLKKGTYVELATHDTKCIESFYQSIAVPQAIPANQFEHQFLQGVPRSILQESLVNGTYFDDLKDRVPQSALGYLDRLKETGVPVRMYLPFGTANVSGAYCRRRLRENPNMITYGIKNLLGLE